MLRSLWQVCMRSSKEVVIPGVPVRGDRRQKRSMFYFNAKALRGRRRGPRRAEDHYHRGRPGYFVDIYQREIGLLGLFILLLSVSDAFMTLELLRNGAVEINPVMDFLIKENINRFVAFKLALTGLAVVLLVRYVHFYLVGGLRVLSVLRTVCYSYGGLIGYELVLLGLV